MQRKKNRGKVSKLTPNVCRYDIEIFPAAQDVVKIATGVKLDNIVATKGWKEEPKIDISCKKWCPYGSYLTADNNSACQSVTALPCKTCPPSTTNEGGFNDLESCLPCPDGHELLPKSPMCSPCKLGTSSTGGKDCSRCALGTHAAQPGEARCTPCSPGFFTDQVGASDCAKCGNGYYGDGTFCAPCYEGFNCLPGARTPQGTGECAAGAFNNGTACEPCSAGSFKDGLGREACTVCSPGTYRQDAGWREPCIACPAGTAAGTEDESLRYFSFEEFTNDASKMVCDTCKANGAPASNVVYFNFPDSPTVNSGWRDGALRFNGENNIVELPPWPLTKKTISFEVMFKSSNVQASTLLDFDLGSYKILVRDNACEFEVAFGFQDFVVDSRIIAAKMVFEVGVWTHLVATLNTESALALYKNGALVGMKIFEEPFEFEPAQTHYRIGASASGDEFMKGELRFLAVHGEELLLPMDMAQSMTIFGK